MLAQLKAIVEQAPSALTAIWRLVTADATVAVAVVLLVALVLIVLAPSPPRPMGRRSQVDPGYVRWLELKVQLYESALRFYARPELYVPHTKDELPPIVSERGDMAYHALTEPGEV